jgi:hypothetical protein
MCRFNGQADWTDIHVDAGPNRARRIVTRLVEESCADPSK